MRRTHRFDAVGMFHHVMNRGVSLHPILERQDDYRYLMMLLACAVRDARIQVHGFSLVPNHYHVLVESCDGQLGETIRRIQTLFADGPRVSTPMAHTRSAKHAVDAGRARAPGALTHTRSSLFPWDVLEVGLLQILVTLGFRTIGDTLGLRTSPAAKRFQRHREAMEDVGYASIAATTAKEALEFCYGAQGTAIAKSVLERGVSPGVGESS